MVTYVCNMCGDKVSYNHAYITKLNAGDIADEWVFCPNCFASILRKCSSKQDRRFTRNIFEDVNRSDTVEPAIEKHAVCLNEDLPFPVKKGKRLTEEAKAWACETYAKGGVTYSDIAKKLNVSPSTVLYIINNSN